MPMLFSDKRLEVARVLARQAGRTWTGLSIAERDALMAAAERAVRDADRAFCTAAEHS